MQKKYKEEDWSFLNMNSPANLYAAYHGDTLTLSEYDRCRDGHALISKFYVDKDFVFFKTEIHDMGNGVGIGLYMGDGCYSDYYMAVCDGKGISIRIPNGVPCGDTFRIEGPKRYHVVAYRNITCKEPFQFGFKKVNHEITIYINEKEVLSNVKVYFPFHNKKNGAKLLIKAMNEYAAKDSSEAMPKATSVFGKYLVNHLLETYVLEGICQEVKNGKVLEGVLIHVLGDFPKWGKTDERGRFSISGLPPGKHTLICGMEEKTFVMVDVVHDKTVKEISLDFNKKEERVDMPQENLQNELAFLGMNGIWKFDFDKDDVGEKEKWFLKGNHSFSKCIRVPFSWQSLMAFGEEERADADTLHQGNSFTCNDKEIGCIGWYQKSVRVNWDAETELVFAGVSGVSKVWVDEKETGCIIDSYNKHVFYLGKLIPEKEYVITVKVSYEHGNNWACSGKQGFWFTDAPGIWQNVWLRERKRTIVTDVLIYPQLLEEHRWRLDFQIVFDQVGKDVGKPKDYMENENCFEVPYSGAYKAEISYRTPEETAAQVYINGYGTGTKIFFDAVPGKGCYDKKDVYLYLETGRNILEFIGNEGNPVIIDVKLQRIDFDFIANLYLDENSIATLKPNINLETGMLETFFSYEMEKATLWTQKEPYQYKVTVELKEEDSTVNYIRRLGIRDVSVSLKDELGGSYITINDKKTYIRGVLDQGYNPWGIYTYKNITGNMPGGIAFDILSAKDCGYNLIRMHIKDNEPEWYQKCDEIGILVWDELPSNFYGVAADSHWQGMLKRQLKKMIKKHNYHPSVILFSVFNESWGITGDHEKSPWEDAVGQSLIKEYAKLYKNQSSGVLVIDNSGYGKTSETEVIDYHSYPDGFSEARQFFQKLAGQHQEGSSFNFYNSKNKELLKNKMIRDLLQNNCSQNLAELEFIGEETQENQPVLISEFVHTDKQEEAIRIFPQIAGYVRMNIASQENEDASPLTATRIWRDFGYVNEDFSKASYKIVNQENLIYLDYPFLSQAEEDDTLSIPVYLSIWDGDFMEIEEITVDWHIVGIDYQGRYLKTGVGGTIKGMGKREQPFLFSSIEFVVPSGWKAGYLFAKAHHNKKEMAANYIQLEIFPEKMVPKNMLSDTIMEIFPEYMVSQNGFLYDGQYQDKERYLVWGYGEGEIEYQMPLYQTNWTKARLCFEVSNCTCIKGTRITDENLQFSTIEVYVQDIFLGSVKVKGQPSDKRALFSNSSVSLSRESKYSRTGIYGYGYRSELQLTQEIISKIKVQSFLNLKLKAVESGIVVYGNRMGRYGCNPIIELK